MVSEPPPSPPPPGPGAGNLQAPEDLWGRMSAKEQEYFAARARAIEATGTGIDNVSQMRQAHIAIEAEMDRQVAELPDDPQLDGLKRLMRERSQLDHAMLDRTREDLKAVQSARVAELDKFMWRIVWEQTQAQRTADQRAQAHFNTLTLLFSLLSLTVAAIAAYVAATH